MTTRVLIVDDSPTIRGLIKAALSQHPDIDVVGGAGDPHEAREAIKTLNPDVITLDVEMPKMSGIEFLERIMRLRPTPVIMCSTLTQQGASITIEALEMGAVDCVGKPDFDALPDKIRAAARARLRPLGERPAAKPADPSFKSNGKLLAIGSSTGGVEALITVLSDFPEQCPPTVITQHMPASFTTSFAARLDRVCRPKVQEAFDGAVLSEGRIYLAPGGTTHLTVTGAAHPVCRLVESDPVNGHRPSVDVLFKSVASTLGDKAVGVILTGMGKDGAAGLKVMLDHGAATFGQDEASCVVYGMPRAAFEMGAVQRQLSLSSIAAAALNACSVKRKESA
jgi:two-component system chemotaxis response regulator CheB